MRSCLECLECVRGVGEDTVQFGEELVRYFTSTAGVKSSATAAAAAGRASAAARARDPRRPRPLLGALPRFVVFYAKGRDFIRWLPLIAIITVIAN